MTSGTMHTRNGVSQWNDAEDAVGQVVSRPYQVGFLLHEIEGHDDDRTVAIRIIETSTPTNLDLSKAGSCGLVITMEKSHVLELGDSPSRHSNKARKDMKNPPTESIDIHFCQEVVSSVLVGSVARCQDPWPHSSMWCRRSDAQALKVKGVHKPGNCSGSSWKESPACGTAGAQNIKTQHQHLGAHSNPEISTGNLILM